MLSASPGPPELRLYGLSSSIRILLDDNPYNLSSGGPGDADNIPLAAVVTGGLIPGTSSWLGNGGKSYYFATATNVNDLIQTGTTAKGVAIYGPDPNWIVPNVAKGAVVPPNKPSLFGLSLIHISEPTR